MRVHIKKQILELMHTMLQMHTLINSDCDNYKTYVDLCCNAANSLIATIDNECENTTKVIENYITLLEKTTADSLILSNDIAELNDTINTAIELVAQIENTYFVVFFPYNASMWDCLESIYFAALEDKNCVCTVVPIPYYKYDQATNKWNFAYDGELFPKNIPIVHYSNYDIEKLLPDIAYIHNPYDDFNYVTKVEKAYFSNNLKKYVNKLVYVPYYLRPEYAFLPAHKLYLQSYYHVDYIIKQDERLRNMFIDTPFFNKTVALGTPKADKILRMQEEGVTLNAEWAHIIKNRKTVMVNLTIGSFLRYGEFTIKKILEIIMAAQKNDVVIVFRPHPLLESTIEAMRPGAKKTYNQLLALLVKSGIGIIDKTPDIIETAVICDAYIGCYSGSGSNYFKILNKPAYNTSYVYNIYSENKTTSYIPRFKSFTLKDNFYWCICEETGFVFKLSLDFKTLEFVYVESIPMHGTFLFNGISSNDDKLIITQKRLDTLVSYDYKNNESETLFEEEKLSLWGFEQVLQEKSKLYYLPTLFQSKIMVCDLDKKSVKKYSLCVKDFRGEKSTCALSGCVNKNILYACAADNKNVLQFSTLTGKHKILNINGESGYSHVLEDNNFLWLICSTKPVLVRYSLTNKTTKIYNLSSSLKVSSTTSSSDMSLFSTIHKVGDYIVIVPGFTSGICAFNIKTNESFVLGEELFEKVFTEQPSIEICRFSKVLSDKEILLQRFNDRALFIFNIEEKSYTEVSPQIEQSELERLKQTALSCPAGEIRIVDNELISLDEFMCYVKNIDTKAKLDAPQTDPVETSGQKIHNFVINEISKEYENLGSEI